MPAKSYAIEERVIKAFEAMDNDLTLKGIAIAAKFRAPYDRLMAWRRGRPLSHSRGGQNKKLSAPQDDALKEYIIIL
jgi:hypothetical protein